MISVALTVYVVGVVVTWAYAGLLTGKQFYRVVKANPTAPVQINWQSVWYEGLTWIGFWASFVGERLEKRKRVEPLTLGDVIGDK